MKTILKIARTELALLFYSPIAWFLLIAFLFQCGLAYTGEIENLLTVQGMGGENLKHLSFLTRRALSPPLWDLGTAGGQALSLSALADDGIDEQGDQWRDDQAIVFFSYQGAGDHFRQ